MFVGAQGFYDVNRTDAVSYIKDCWNGYDRIDTSEISTFSQTELFNTIGGINKQIDSISDSGFIYFTTIKDGRPVVKSLAVEITE